MDFSMLKAWQEVSETGVVYEIGSIYARLLKLTDLRKARGKQYGLEMLLMIILLAKLSGTRQASRNCRLGKEQPEETG